MLQQIARRLNVLLDRCDVQLVRKSTLERLHAQAFHSPAAAFPPGTWAVAPLRDGTRLWVDLGDNGISRPAMFDAYEPRETAFIRKHLGQDSVFVDIGSNIGWYTVKAAVAVGAGGRVYAFEPRAESYLALSRTIAENNLEGRVTLFNLALGDRPGTFNICWANQTDNPGGTWLLTDASVEATLSVGTHTMQAASVARLDDVIDPPRLDMVKIDVEGSELRALAGAERLLRHRRPIILTEISRPLLPLNSHCTAAEYLTWVMALGYRPHLLEEGGELGPSLKPESLPSDMDVFNVALMPI